MPECSASFWGDGEAEGAVWRREEGKAGARGGQEGAGQAVLPPRRADRVHPGPCPWHLGPWQAGPLGDGRRSPWQTTSCPSRAVRTSARSCTGCGSSWCSASLWQCPALGPPGWATGGQAAGERDTLCLVSLSLPGAWAAQEAAYPRLGSPGSAPPPCPATHTEDHALQRVLRLAEQPPADLRGAGSGSRMQPRVQPPSARARSSGPRSGCGQRFRRPTDQRSVLLGDRQAAVDLSFSPSPTS